VGSPARRRPVWDHAPRGGSARKIPFLGRTKEATMLKILLIIVAVLVVLWLVRTMMARSR
jgi:hypothetical protein